MKETTALKTAETLEMSKLIGKTVKSVFYDDKNDHNQFIEGVYGIEFTDNTLVSFSSSGDDATHTSMSIDESKKEAPTMDHQEMSKGALQQYWDGAITGLELLGKLTQILNYEEQKQWERNNEQKQKDNEKHNKIKEMSKSIEDVTRRWADFTTTQ